MYYITKIGDEFIRSLKIWEFKSADPKPDMHYFGDSPLLSAGGYYEKRHGDKHFVLNVNVGTWCFLSPEEYQILKAADNIHYSELQNRFPEIKNEDLEELIFHLYVRNIIAIDNDYFIGETLFSDGPVRTIGPLFIIEPTKRCNLSCKYCFADCTGEKQPSMTKNDANRIIELIFDTDFDYLTIEFTGGETLLEFDFIKYFVKELNKKRRSSSKHIELALQTNATLMDEEKLNYLLENNIQFGFSLDGNEKNNDATRQYSNGKGTYRDIVKAIRLVQSKNQSVGIISVLTNKNSTEYIENMKAYKELGINGVKVNPIYSGGRAEDNWSDLEISDRQILETQTRYLDYFEKEEQPVIEENISYMVSNISTCVRNYRCVISGCGAGENNFTFAPDGNIYPCARYQDDEKYIIGNINDKDIRLQELYKKSDLILAMRSRKTEKIEKCKACIYKRFCEGDCSLSAYEAHENWNSPHPRCDYYKGMYDMLFEHISRNENLPQKMNPMLSIVNLKKIG